MEDGAPARISCCHTQHFSSVQRLHRPEIVNCRQNILMQWQRENIEIFDEFAPRGVLSCVKSCRNWLSWYFVAFTGFLRSVHCNIKSQIFSTNSLISVSEPGQPRCKWVWWGCRYICRNCWVELQHQSDQQRESLKFPVILWHPGVAINRATVLQDPDALCQIPEDILILVGSITGMSSTSSI